MVGCILNHRLSLQPYVPQQMFQRFDPRWSGIHHNFCPSSIDYNLQWRYMLYFFVWYNKITTKIYVDFAVKEFYYLCHFVSFIIHHGANRKCILLTIFLIKKKNGTCFSMGVPVSCFFNISYLSFILCKRTEDCIQLRHSQGKQSHVRVQYRNSLNFVTPAVVVIVILILLLHSMIRRIRKC